MADNGKQRLELHEESTHDNKFVDELSCPICLEFFQNPVQLPCLHNFCQDCLQTKFEYNKSQNKLNSVPFECPTCRFVVPLGEDGIGTLPRCFYLANIVDKFKVVYDRNKDKVQLHDEDKGSTACGDQNQTKDHKHLCSEHNKSLTLFCCTCDLVLCTKCVSKHQSHNFEDIEEKCEKQLVNILFCTFTCSIIKQMF